ncbi:amidohydrolase [Oceanospirillum beijerinckii]|uniref:amidohydrolase n=1 Tax=Oceanospirillum beijerinckii TaxID=64976 RepID=UPI0004030B1D|nr:amidohydrolase [Oceanospirillum beijerinckii]
MCDHPSHHGISCACHGPLQKILEQEITINQVSFRQQSYQIKSAPEDVIFYHPDEKRIITMADGKPTKAHAIAISGEKIVAVGALQDAVKALPNVDPICLQGEQTIIPGLIEPHMHIFITAYLNTWDVDLGPYDGQYLKPVYDLNTINSEIQMVYNKKQALLDESSLKAQYQHLLQQLKQGETPVISPELDSLIKEITLSGYNVDPTLMTAEFENIDKALLDKVSTEIPIVLVNASMHIAYANSAALLLSFNAMGPLQREHFDQYRTAAEFAQGNNGILNEMVEMQAVAPVMPPMNPDALRDGMDNVFDNALSKGITLMLDAATPVSSQPSKSLESLLATYMASHWKTNRMALAYIADTPEGKVGAYPFSSSWKKTSIDDNNRLYAPIIKIVSDGSNQGKTGYQSMPYKGSGPSTPDQSTLNCGIYNFTPENASAYPLGVVPETYSKLITEVTKSDQQWGMMVHANGDRAIDLAVNGFQYLQMRGYDLASRRYRIEHCSLLTDSNAQMMSNLGISPSFLIGHVGYWGWAFQQEILGAERAQLLDRCGTAQSAGMVVTLHSDNNVSPLGPLRYMEQAITRRMERAPQDGSQYLNPQESLTAEQALKAITLNAAWQCQAEQHVGSLEEGKLADFVILAENPLTWNESHGSFVGLRDIEIEETWVGGKKLYSRTENVAESVSKQLQKKLATALT